VRASRPPAQPLTFHVVVYRERPSPLLMLVPRAKIPILPQHSSGLRYLRFLLCDSSIASLPCNALFPVPAMAIDTEAARFFVSAQRGGASFENCLTLGRQLLHVSDREMRQILVDAGMDPKGCPSLFSRSYPDYAEPFWKALGASRADSMDVGDFEGATVTHDLNLPVPDSLIARFDAVCDIGTLEHVFNFLGAIRNALEMVKVGGHFFAVTPANNFFGHGFFQFSPELFFRLLSPENGYRIERMYAVVYGLRHRWYEVVDPDQVRTRVIAINGQPVHLMVQARRLEKVPLLQRFPQQSDYVNMWQTWPQSKARTDLVRLGWLAPWVGRLKNTVLNHAPFLARAIESVVFSSLNRGYSFRNRSCFRPVDKRRLCRSEDSRGQ